MLPIAIEIADLTWRPAGADRLTLDLRGSSIHVPPGGVLLVGGASGAGKSTLLNRLTQAGVLAEDRLFATLDPTSRRIRFPREREVILTDTVGFIRRLPPDLQEAFRATLEELSLDGPAKVLNQRLSLTPVRKLWLAWKTWTFGYKA